MAAFFSHVDTQTDGLQNLEDPTSNDTEYFQRGPLGLEGPDQYADFSAVFYDGYDESQKLL